MRNHYCGPHDHSQKMYKFHFGMPPFPPMFFHGMGEFNLDLELDTKEDAEKFLKRNKKWLESRKARIETHLGKTTAAIDRIDRISSELSQSEDYNADDFQKKLIKEFKKFMIEQIDEE